MICGHFWHLFRRTTCYDEHGLDSEMRILSNNSELYFFSQFLFCSFSHFASWRNGMAYYPDLCRLGRGIWCFCSALVWAGDAYRHIAQVFRLFQRMAGQQCCAAGTSVTSNTSGARNARSSGNDRGLSCVVTNGIVMDRTWHVVTIKRCNVP